MTSLRLDELSVHYGAFVAVDRLSFELRRGELFGLLGPNGAGKSSTLRVLTGQIRPSGGSVTVAGLDLQRDWQALKAKFGYLPDRENHFEELTALRNLQFFAALYGVPAARVDECLALVELQEAARLPVASFSLGMRRKLLLARALLHRPSLLYLDEPTANLDVHSMAVVHRILRCLSAEGVTVLLTTHNMPEAEALCERVAILCRGRLIALDAPWNLRRQHAENRVDVVFKSGTRRTLDLDSPLERAELSRSIAQGEVLSLQSREFDFREAFLKLTGMAYA